MGFSKFLTSLTKNREEVNNRSQPINAELQQGTYFNTYQHHCLFFFSVIILDRQLTVQLPSGICKFIGYLFSVFVKLSDDRRLNQEFSFRMVKSTLRVIVCCHGGTGFTS